MPLSVNDNWQTLLMHYPPEVRSWLANPALYNLGIQKITELASSKL